MDVDSVCRRMFIGGTMQFYETRKDERGQCRESELFRQIMEVWAGQSNGPSRVVEVLTFGQKPQSPLPHFQIQATLYIVKSGYLCVGFAKDGALRFGQGAFFEGLLVPSRTSGLQMKGLPQTEVFVVTGSEDVLKFVAPPSNGP